jgi:hypothetical protein
MKLKLLVIGIVAFVISCSSIVIAGQTKSEQNKPGEIEVMEMTLEAVVEAVDYDTRKVTLKDLDGNLVTIVVENQVKNLPQVEVGDTVNIKYIEVVAIQVFSADQAEAGVSKIAAAKGAEGHRDLAPISVTDS